MMRLSFLSEHDWPGLTRKARNASTAGCWRLLDYDRVSDPDDSSQPLASADSVWSNNSEGRPLVSGRG